MNLSSAAPKPPAYNPRDNRLTERVTQYLDTLGNWHTYRNAATMAEVLGIVGHLTRSFLGVDLGGRLSLTGILGAVIALHTLERLTGAAATLGIRLAAGSGHILAWQHGVVVRASPSVAHTARAMRWLLGSRLLSATGGYFHLGGRTWHYQVLDLRVWGAERVLAHLRSVSLPHRAHYFDRDIGWAAAVEIALGRRMADLTLGHLGSINELEHAVGLLARARLIAIAAGWLLIDPDERTAAAQSHSPSPAGPALNRANGPTVVSSSGMPVPPTADGSPPAEVGRYAMQLPLMRAAQTNGHGVAPLPPPGDWIKNRYHLNGYAYPLFIRKVVINPVSRQRKAEAWYHDGRQWRPVTSDADRIALADDFDNGRLHPQPWPQPGVT